MFSDLLHFAHTCAFHDYFVIGVSIISVIINIIIFSEKPDIENFFLAILRTIVGILGALAIYYLFFILIGVFISFLYVFGILFLIICLIVLVL